MAPAGVYFLLTVNQTLEHLCLTLGETDHRSSRREFPNPLSGEPQKGTP